MKFEIGKINSNTDAFTLAMYKLKVFNVLKPNWFKLEKFADSTFSVEPKSLDNTPWGFAKKMVQTITGNAPVFSYINVPNEETGEIETTQAMVVVYPVNGVNEISVLAFRNGVTRHLLVEPDDVLYTTAEEAKQAAKLMKEVVVTGHEKTVAGRQLSMLAMLINSGFDDELTQKAYDDHLGDYIQVKLRWELACEKYNEFMEDIATL